MSQVSSVVSTLVLFVGCVYSHSWLHCSDYSSPSTLNGGGTFSDDNCNGYIRQWLSVWGATSFGTDRGVNYQPSGSWCQSSFNSDIDSMYDDGYPMAEWNYGETVTLVWPAKNHANYECTDNIPDNSMKLFYNNNVNPSSELSYSSGVGNPTGDGWTLLIDWINDLGCTAGTDGCGFQNCPNYCADTGLAPCWQQYTVSSSDFASAGKYTLMWYWEFNAGSYYTTCFEVEIAGNTTTGGGDDDDTDGDDDDDDDDDDDSDSFDDYIIQIPLLYNGASYSETTLLSGANSMEIDDVTFDFVVVNAKGIDTTKWNATLQTFTNSPGSLFNEAYDYTSSPEGDSQLCDKVEEAFGSGTCTIEPGIITIYGLTSSHTTDGTNSGSDDSDSPAGSSGSNRIHASLNKIVFVSLGLILFFVES